MPSHQPTAGYMAVKPEYLSSQPSPMASKSEPNRNKSYDPKKPHITDTPLTRYNWYKHVNWLNVTLIVLVPLYGCIGAFWTPIYWQTAILVSRRRLSTKIQKFHDKSNIYIRHSCITLLQV